MKLALGSKVKRGILAVAASIAALVASFAILPSSPAFAYTTLCSGEYGTTVVFRVCVQQTATTAARGYVTVIRGSAYISGKLELVAPPDGFVYTACSGQFYAPSTCYTQSVNGGHAVYYARWHSSGGSYYSSPALTL